MNGHKHRWFEAVLKNDPNKDFWICLRCGKTSPGPTDNEDLDPRKVDK